MQKVATLKPNAETKRSVIETERSFILGALHIYVNIQKVAEINDFLGYGEKERPYISHFCETNNSNKCTPCGTNSNLKSFTLRNNSNRTSETNESIMCPAKWWGSRERLTPNQRGAQHREPVNVNVTIPHQIPLHLLILLGFQPMFRQMSVNDTSILIFLL